MTEVTGTEKGAGECFGGHRQDLEGEGAVWNRERFQFECPGTCDKWH